jgi:hypothetical protein
MGILVRLIGSGIGLASEALHNRKLNKAEEKRLAASGGESSSANASRSISHNDHDAPPEYVELPEKEGRELIAQGRAVPADTKYPDEKAARNPYDDEDDDASSEEGDEEAWQLDEASRELVETPSDEQRTPQEVGSLIDAFIRSHPPPSPHAPHAPLPCPVILPQRRPRDKKRGFVRAYAPVLEDCGIDQATFLEFLKTFQMSCRADKWLQVVNLSAGIVGLVPGPITMGVSIAVQFAVGVAMEVQRLSRLVEFPDLMPLYLLILQIKLLP